MITKVGGDKAYSMFQYKVLVLHCAHCNTLSYWD